MLSKRFREAVEASANASMEAIDYQGGRSKLASRLVTAFEYAIENNGGNSRDISKIIFEETGLRLDFKFESGCDAYIYPVQLSTASTLLNPTMGGYYKQVIGEYVKEHQRKLKDVSTMRGTIDRRKGKVTGVFSEVISSMAIGKGLWKTLGMSAEELAAVTTHEIGHAFTFIDCLTETLSVNVAINSTLEALRQTTDREVAVELIRDTAKTLDMSKEATEAMVDAKPDSRTYTALYLQSKWGQRDDKSSAGSKTYDLRGAEFSADQFATRHGLGVQLMTGLDKIFAFDPSWRASDTKIWVVRAMSFAMMILTSVLTAGLLPLLMFLSLFSSGVENHIYDHSAERLTRIRNDLVIALKSSRLTREQKDLLLKDISTADSMIATVKDHPSLFNLLWISLASSRRKQYRATRLQQELERLLASPMFTESERLRSAI